MSRNLTPDEDDSAMDRGRAIHASVYPRSEKEIELEGVKIDMIKGKEKTICEVKSSDKFISASRMQLLYYIYRLREEGVEVNGEVLIPKSKKRVPVSLGPDEERALARTFEQIRKIVAMDSPPKAVRIPFCRKCAYRDFCWGVDI